MKVQQFLNHVNGNPVMNHFIIRHERVEYFQSYDSVIVKKENGKITLGLDWNYSQTTSKYRSQYLGETTKETQKKLDAGIYLFDPDL